MNPMLSSLGSLTLALLLVPTSPGSTQADAEAKKAIEAVQKEFDTEFREAIKATQDLPREEANLVFEDFFANVVPDFSARLAQIARAHKGTPSAFEAWSRVINFSGRSDMRSERGTALLDEALQALTTDHIESEALAGLTLNLRYSSGPLGEERVLAALEGVAARSPHRSVRAAALYGQAAVLGEERADGDPRIPRAKAILTGLQEDLGDVEYREGQTYAEAAGALLFALENLVVGKPCPDFAAVDAEGASFKLSDYRGKVVLIDFWGFW